MKQYNFFLFGIILCVTIVVQIQAKSDTLFYLKDNSDTGIEFIQNDWPGALGLAKQQHKLIFLDAYATWCGPCKLMQKKVFTGKKAGDYFNLNFINVSIDMEKGDGIALAKQLNISAYPSLLVINEDGKIITRNTGALNEQQLIEFGKKAIAGMKK